MIWRLSVDECFSLALRCSARWARRPNRSPHECTLRTRSPAKSLKRHEYRVALTARQALHLVVNQLGVDVVVIVSGPEGESLVQMDSPNGANGPEPVWIVAAKTGDYTVSVDGVGLILAVL